VDLKELKVYKVDFFDDPDKFQEFIDERAGGECPSLHLDSTNVVEKCAYDFTWNDYLFNKEMGGIYDDVQQCIE